MLSDRIFQFDVLVQFPYLFAKVYYRLIRNFCILFHPVYRRRLRIRISPTALSNSQRKMSVIMFEEKYFTLFQSRTPRMYMVNRKVSFVSS